LLWWGCLFLRVGHSVSGGVVGDSKCKLDNRVQETGSGLGSSRRNICCGIRWLVEQWNFCLNAQCYFFCEHSRAVSGCASPIYRGSGGIVIHILKVVSRSVFLISHRGSHEEWWNIGVQTLKRRDNFQISPEISREFLSGSWQYCSNFLRYPPASLFSGI
jgi:hypothetical protein